MARCWSFGHGGEGRIDAERARDGSGDYWVNYVIPGSAAAKYQEVAVGTVRNADPGWRIDGLDKTFATMKAAAEFLVVRAPFDAAVGVNATPVEPAIVLDDLLDPELEAVAELVELLGAIQGDAYALDSALFDVRRWGTYAEVPADSAETTEQLIEGAKALEQAARDWRIALESHRAMAARVDRAVEVGGGKMHGGGRVVAGFVTRADSEDEARAAAKEYFRGESVRIISCECIGGSGS